MLESASAVAMAPDGNGGLYEALEKTGALAHMESKGVEWVPQYCVDNALVKVADPVFVGYCVEAGGDCAAKVCYFSGGSTCGWSGSKNKPSLTIYADGKVINKTDPTEKIGVIVMKDGRTEVVEYSELDDTMLNARNPDGKLTFAACHMCINYFSREFLVRAAEAMVDQMPLHVARKAIPYYVRSPAPPRPPSRCARI